MSNQDIFTKRHIDPSKMGKIESLLVHFNLPSKAVDYYREHQLMLKGVVVGIIFLIVAVSLYDSWRSQRIESASLSLSKALDQAEDSRKAALAEVKKEYSGTASGVWAEVELAHLDMKNKAFADAEKKYAELHKKVDVANPLFALTLYGIAQAQEAQENLDAAYMSYTKLKDVEAYRMTGYFGMARIHEKKNELEKALGIFNQYKSFLNSPDADKNAIGLVDEKIARVKAKQ